VHNVMRVRGYTIDGELLELGSGALDSPGLDLLRARHRLRGSVTGRHRSDCQNSSRGAAVWPNSSWPLSMTFAKAGDAVAAIIAAGIIPAGLEMMDRKATAAVEPFVKAGYDLNAEAILLAEADGTPEEVADQVAEIERVVRAAGRRHGDSPSRAPKPNGLRFWSGRKNAFPAAGRISADYYCMDGTIPRKKPRPDAEGNRGHGADSRATLYETCFHAGDGNLHPLILFDAKRARRMGSVPICLARRSWSCV